MVLCRGISPFRVGVVARYPKQENVATAPIEAIVDSGSELTWLPGDVLRSVGITPRRKRLIATATQQKVERAESTDMILLGVRALEGFGVAVDNVAHRFVSTTTIVAAGDNGFDSRSRTMLRRILVRGVESPK